MTPLLPHPAAELFPMMDGPAHDALAADIRENGLREPVVLHEGRVLDGRNRWTACLEVGLQPDTRQWGSRPGDGTDPVAFVVSANLQRRHLDESQRAIVAARIATLPKGANQHSPNGGSSQAQAAGLLNVGKRTVERARKVLDKAEPEVVAAVEQGHMTVSVAAKLADLPPDTQRKAAAKPKTAPTAAKQHARAAREAGLAQRTAEAATEATGKLYGVVYADPPWRFEPYSRDTGLDRAADNHYPTMDLEQIASLPIPAAPDCALFLWATVPMLPQALHVLASWGFTYRSACAWHKPRPGTGYWFRNTLELLLVGTRGNVPAPAPGQQYDQVIEAAVGAHSAKPHHFAEMIEELFPNTPRIELFARGPRLGWDVWGNEAQEQHDAA